MTTTHKTWWGQRYKTRGAYYYPRLRENPIDYEVPIYRLAEGKCTACGRAYPMRVGLEIEIVRQYPDPHVKPQDGQRCLACEAARKPKARDWSGALAARRSMRRERWLGWWWLLGALLFVGAVAGVTLAVSR